MTCASVTVDRRKRRRRGQDEDRISTKRWNENVCDTPPNTKYYALKYEVLCTERQHEAGFFILFLADVSSRK